MYLDRSTISTLLQNCGYDLTDVPVYVSSEYALTKRTGKLFKKVLELESVSPNEVLHLGDNLRSDWFRPKVYLDSEFEEYCICDDYYQPVVEDFELEYRINDWCRKNGFKIISCEGDGDDSGFEPDSVRRWIKYR